MHRRKLPAKVFLLSGIATALLPFLVLLPPGKAQADEPSTNSPLAWRYEATNHLGAWIWDTNTSDKQTVHFWREFQISRGSIITNATLRITADNGFVLYLDGSEIGRGSDWRTVSEYNITELLKPGRHFLAVEGFNDIREGGFIFGMSVESENRPLLEVFSDKNWLVFPPGKRNWVENKQPPPSAHPARVIGPMLTRPWEIWPVGFANVPPLHPVVIHFWQRGWFQLTLLASCLAALLACVWLMTRLAAQSRSQRFLQRQRTSIARDIHDDLGAQLTQLLLIGEVAQREQPVDSPARVQFAQICDHARELAHAMDEVVWAVNARRDTVRDFTSYVCKYAQIFLAPTGIRCRLDVEPEIPAMAFDLPVRRNLFLAVKEALNNAAKYSGADELFLRIFRQHQQLSVVVEDNGRGFDPGQTGGERNGLTNMAQRLAEVGGTCHIDSQPGGGCRVVFTVPLQEEKQRWFQRFRSAHIDAELN
jgi:signal transduction histidine kinase